MMKILARQAVFDPMMHQEKYRLPAQMFSLCAG